jgi:FkbM family methyltransferase
MPEFRPGTWDEKIWGLVNRLNEYRLPPRFQPEDVILDVGAHIGSFSNACLERGAGRVYAFEANLENYRIAVKNLASWGRDRCQVEHTAVWRSDDTDDFLWFTPSSDPLNTGGGNVVFENEERVQICGDECQCNAEDFNDGSLVGCIGLDAILEDSGPVRLLKLDCEGSEFPILYTSKRLDQVEEIVGEFHEVGGLFDSLSIPEHVQIDGRTRFLMHELSNYLTGQGFEVTWNRSLHPDGSPTNLGYFRARRIKLQKHLLLIGAWGDVLCTLGGAMTRAAQIKAVGQECTLIYYGFDPEIARFLRLQGHFDSVIHVAPDSDEGYWGRVEEATDPRVPVSWWLNEIVFGTGIRPEDVTPMHVGSQWDRGDPITRWSGPKLPREIRKVADLLVEACRFRFDSDPILVYPRSEQSTCWEDHWPHWDQAVAWLLAHTDHPIILCGQRYESDLSHPRLLNLVGQTASMMQVFALAEAAGSVITTVNSLSHWCWIQGIPAVACANRTIADKDDYFRRALSSPSIRLVEMDDDLEDFQEAYAWLMRP